MGAKEETAVNGTWKKGPGTELFAALEKVSPSFLWYIRPCNASAGHADASFDCTPPGHTAALSVHRCKVLGPLWGAPAVTVMHANMLVRPWVQLSACAVQELGHVPIIAEDLGVITADVHALRQSIGAPGMVVLQFAWGSGPTNTHLPHNHYENSVCYPGEAPFGST